MPEHQKLNNLFIHVVENRDALDKLS